MIDELTECLYQVTESFIREYAAKKQNYLVRFPKTQLSFRLCRGELRVWQAVVNSEGDSTNLLTCDPEFTY